MSQVFNTILFRPRQSRGEIKDFEITFINASSEGYEFYPGRKKGTLLRDLPARAIHFEDYKKIALQGGTLVLEITESSNSGAKILSTISGNQGHILEFWKYWDPVENPDKNIGVIEKGDLPPVPMTVNEKIFVEKKTSETGEFEKKLQALNKELISKNRELEHLSSEFSALSSIAANDYKEALKKMYTSLEYVISHDAAMLSNEGRANLRRVQSGIQRMKLLTEDIVSFSSLEELPEKKKFVNLHDYLEQVKNVISGQMNGGDDIIISCEKIDPVNGYPTMLYLLFYHLLDNAVKFRSRDRNLHIQINCAQVNGLYINHADASPDTIYDLISITDNGIGFEQELAGKIFSIFYRIEKTNKFKGSGTGLAFCRRIMQVHDGFINAEGYPGKGAVFNCYFPRAYSDPTTPK